MSECSHDFDSNELSNYCAKGCGETWALYTIKNLQKENDILREALGDVLNYLHWSGDSLKGDDLIGDENLTKVYNEKIEIIEKALEKVKNE